MNVKGQEIVMSQYPPQPPQQPPYGQPPGQPPYGQPPMQQYGMPGTPMPSGGTSGAAIASLICGIIGCLGITALLSIVLGFVGISATSNRRKTGRGMAIAGLVLGILWIGIYLLFGSGLYALYVGSKPVKAAAEQFTNDMLKGDVASAAALCDPNMAQADLQSSSDQMKSWGTLTNLT